ncbi:MAG: hypothetical protein H6815_02605 [Phycisphaeraceae bacterium]|nr:hypothetical protein [Phycisphaerales bacterium]MCB9859317.1 hypothetical protein [Phycisphaeraceae bacterium]
MRYALGFGLVCALGTIATAQPTGKDCTNTSVSLTPLIDLAAGLYQGYEGGLYPGGIDTPPIPHLIAGINRGERVRPLNESGIPDPDGTIVLLTIGMSNTGIESNALIDRYGHFANSNARVKVVNGAQSGQTAAIIADPSAAYWSNVLAKLEAANVSPAQVQAVWLKEADKNPTDPFPVHAETLRDEFESIVNILTDMFPNLRQCTLSSRIYAGYGPGPLNPEPYAYESGFSVKWLIEDQIQGKPSLNFHPLQGPVEAPWLGWAAYTWADGLVPRSDGLIWECDDFASDGVHPSQQGAAKVANMLVQTWANDPTTRPWFVGCQPDMTNDGNLNIFDYIAFSNAYVNNSLLADCDHDRSLSIFDFICFGNQFSMGCQ